MQYFGDANDGYFVIIGDEIDAGRGHSRAAHAEKLRAGARAQTFGQACGVHVARGFARGDENLRRHERNAERNPWRH